MKQLVMLVCLLLWPSLQAVGQAKSGNAIATVKRFLALRAQGKQVQVLAMLAPNARIWFEERQGEGAPWTFPGRWTHWDDYFNGKSHYSHWRQSGNQVMADGQEINDFYRLIERPRQAFQASWWLDEQGRLIGFLFKPVKRQGTNRDRLDEVKLWAKQHRPAELEYLMPNGEIDPTGDRPQRWHVMLVEWRKAVRLPALKLRAAKSRNHASSPNSSAIQAQASAAQTRRVVVESSGWQIVGDLLMRRSKRPVPAVIMLNGAARDRTEYAGLAARLAEQGIASLRLDLRGHGESINKGKFIPFDEKSIEAMIKISHEDVTAVFRYLKTLPGIDAERIGFVGASYSGESMAEAARKSGYGRAYVALSPGSFSDESIALIDGSSIPWLFVKSANERNAVMKDLFTALREKSRQAEIIEFAGTEHGSRILAAQPELAEMLAVWFKHHLGGSK